MRKTKVELEKEIKDNEVLIAVLCTIGIIVTLLWVFNVGCPEVELKKNECTINFKYEIVYDEKLSGEINITDIDFESLRCYDGDLNIRRVI